MDIRTFAELTTPDERSLRFTPLGLATGGKLSPENAAEFQQPCIAAADRIRGAVLVADTETSGHLNKPLEARRSADEAEKGIRRT
jgi:hypothetical protein